MVYTMLLLRHSALIVVRQKYLVTFFRCVVVIKRSSALACPFVTTVRETKL
mgnify:CR=1 FL=1